MAYGSVFIFFGIIKRFFKKLPGKLGVAVMPTKNVMILVFALGAILACVHMTVSVIYWYRKWFIPYTTKHKYKIKVWCSQATFFVTVSARDGEDAIREAKKIVTPDMRSWNFTIEQIL